VRVVLAGLALVLVAGCGAKKAVLPQSAPPTTYEEQVDVWKPVEKSESVFFGGNRIIFNNTFLFSDTNADMSGPFAVETRYVGVKRTPMEGNRIYTHQAAFSKGMYIEDVSLLAEKPFQVFCAVGLRVHAEMKYLSPGAQFNDGRYMAVGGAGLELKSGFKAMRRSDGVTNSVVFGNSWQLDYNGNEFYCGYYLDRNLNDKPEQEIAEAIKAHPIDGASIQEALGEYITLQKKVKETVTSPMK
jgi:hypothetical protein